MHPENTFDIIYKTESTRLLHNETVHVMQIKAAFTIYLYWGETSGAIYDYSGTYPIAITCTECEINVEIDDKILIESDLSEYAKLTNLDDYRKYNDFDVNITVDLPIEHKTPEEAYDFMCETAHVEFHEGAQLEGYVLAWNDETEDYVFHKEFNITFHTSRAYDYGEHRCDTIMMRKKPFLAGRCKAQSHPIMGFLPKLKKK